MNDNDTDDIRIAVYIRLSLADEESGHGKDESNSVTNQRSLIHSFLDRNEELCAYPRTEFVDDGYTGTNTNRPAFQRMIEQIKNGSYNLCISKDFSRLTRDYIEMGDYLECLFPFLHVRYISINDGYDSRDYKGTTGGLDVVMRTIVYDAYSKDLSVKETTGKKLSRKKGKRASGDPPYGYIPDPDNKGMDLIDPEAAEIVRRIFDEALAGRKITEIARQLNEEQILSPAKYWRQKHPDTNRYANMSDKQGWTYSAIHNILTRYAYTGASVGGLRKLTGPCSKSSHAVDFKDWIIVPGMHEAIITVEEYEQIQKIIRHTKKEKSHREYPLKSLIVCGNCGRHMRRCHQTHKYSCSYGRYSKDSVCKEIHSPKEEKLVEILDHAIKDLILRFEQRKKNIRKKKAVDADTQMESVAMLRNRISQIKRENLKLYENYCEEKIDKADYLVKKQIFETQMEETEQAIIAAQQKECKLREEKYFYSEMEAVCNTFKGEAFSYEMAHAFVDRIVIYPDDRIEIKWKFKDCLEKLTERTVREN